MSRRDESRVRCLACRLAGVLAALATCVLACDCGNGNPGRDADAGEDRADDAVDEADDAGDAREGVDEGDDDGFEEADVPEAFDGDGEDAGERYIAPWDGDLDYAEYAAEHDCTPPEPVAGCETPGTETPIWERSVGDEWCINPIYRDLRPLWREVAPGCEQVTYLDYIGGPVASDSYDVWDGRLVAIGSGITLVDAQCRSELRIQAEERAIDGSYVSDGWPAISRERTLHERHWRTDSDGYATVLVSQQLDAGRKRLVQLQRNADRADSSGTLYPLDAWGESALARRQRTSEPRCDFDVVGISMVSGAVLGLSGTDLPFGRCVWAGSLWENTGVVSGSSWNLHLVDVTTPGVRVFGETAPCQWNAVVQGDTVCWEQTTEFCPLDTGPGNRVFCAGLGDGTPWDASPVVTCEDGTACGACEPTVFGPWVAWVLTPATVCFGYEVALLNRRTAQEYRLFDRTPGFRPTGLVYDLRIWGNHLYFLTEPPGVGGNAQVHRCDLRVLFPEAYE